MFTSFAVTPLRRRQADSQIEDAQGVTSRPRSETAASGSGIVLATHSPRAGGRDCSDTPRLLLRDDDGIRLFAGSYPETKKLFEKTPEELVT